MAVKTKLEINSFIKGLITEAGALNFPDNASLVDQNFVLNSDGSRNRRLGLKKQVQGGSHFYSINPGEVYGDSVHIWKNPLQTGAYDIIVVQLGSDLRFYKSKPYPIIDNLITTYTLPAAHNKAISIVGDSIRGQFVLTYGSDELVVLDYNEITSTVSATYRRIEVRDVFGIDDGFDLTERPLYPEKLDNTYVNEVRHLYNLRNQGWPDEAQTALNADGSKTGTVAVAPRDPVRVDINEETPVYPMPYPSNADVFWRARVASAVDASAVGAYSPWELLKQDYGSTPAPRGRAVIDIFNRDESRAEFLNSFDNFLPGTVDTEYLNVPLDRSVGWVSQIAAYAGRMFYSVKVTTALGGDENTPKLNTMVFFSQVAKSDEHIARAYSEADPTSEYMYDTVDTDGGFVVIPEAGEILRLAPLGESLFIICSNGVWELHGGERAFSATNVNLAKTTSVGGLSSKSVLVAESVLTYWADGGIYLISVDETSQRGLASNITAPTIQSLYKAIPLAEKKKATGVYDIVDRRIRWIYSPNNDPVWPPTPNNELVLDLDLQAFYLNVIQAGAAITFRQGLALPDLVYLCMGRQDAATLEYSFYSYADIRFKDFETYDAKAILVTGALTGGTGSSDKQTTSLVMHFNRTENGYQLDGDALLFDNPSSCTVTPQWEWTNSAHAGKWGQPFEAYRLPRAYYPTGLGDPFNYSYTVITSKNGIRGRGRALSLRMESKPEHDLHILGWGLELKVDEKF